MTDHAFPPLPFEIVSLILEHFIQLSPREHGRSVCLLSHSFLNLGRRGLYSHVVLRFERDERYFVWCMLRSGPQEPVRPHPLATLVRSIERRDEDVSVASPTTLVLLGKLFRYPKHFLERLESTRLLTYFDNLDVVSAFVSSSDAQLPMAISAEMCYCNRGDAAAGPVPTSLHLLSSRIDEVAFVAAVSEYPTTLQRVCVSIFPYLDQRVPPRPSPDTRNLPNAAGRLRIESYPGVIRTLYEGLARRPHQPGGHGLGLLVLRYDRTCGEFCMVPRCAQHPGSPYRNHVRPSDEEGPGAEGVGTKLVTICCDWGQAAPTSSARDVARDKAFVKRVWERMLHEKESVWPEVPEDDTQPVTHQSWTA